MGNPRHKRHAEQHPARRRRDQLRRLHKVRMPAVVMIACAAVIVGLVASATAFGVPSGTPGGMEVAVFVVTCIVFIQQLVAHVLPVSTESEYSEPGITEEGLGYPGSPISVFGLWHIDIHLNAKRPHHDD